MKNRMIITVAVAVLSGAAQADFFSPFGDQSIDAPSELAARGAAVSLATQTDLQNIGAGEKALGVGVGTFGGKSALGVNFAANRDGTIFSGAAGTTGKGFGFRAGAAWKF